MWKRLKKPLIPTTEHIADSQLDPVQTSTIPDDWKIWIWHNVGEGRSKDGIFRILHDHGFGYDLIRRELNYEPGIPLEQIENPLEAAKKGSRAKRQNRVRAMRLSGRTRELYLPNAELVSSKLELYLLKDFLTCGECQKVVELFRGNLRPSTITKKDEPDKYLRTSKTCDLSQLKNPFVRELDRRICSIMGIDPAYSEGIQAQLYDVGEQFKPHTDYFEPNSREFKRFAKIQGQRTWTFMIYLNDTESGGETRFSSLGRTFSPCQGTALIWNNLNDKGEPNPDTLHQGMPVESGYKAIITKWFRKRGSGKMFTKGPNEYIPNYTRSGFKQLRSPPDLYHELLQFYERSKEKAIVENVEGHIENRHGHGSELIELPDSLKARVHEELQPECERWCGEKLEPTYVYGIRRYRNGAVLIPHRDRIETHMISAILFITQDVNEEWPLEIEDNYYRTHKIVASPGEMLLYEGGRLKHGRPTPLNGEYFCNVFIHYRPKGHRFDAVEKGDRLG